MNISEDQRSSGQSLKGNAQLHSPLSKIVEAWAREDVRIVVDPFRCTKLKTNARVPPNDPIIDHLTIQPRFTCFLKVGYYCKFL